MKIKVKIVQAFLLFALIILLFYPSYCFAQSNPTITNPSTDNLSYNRGNRTISWSAVSGATYSLSMRDLTANMKSVIVNVGTATSYTIPMKYFYEGHQYRVAVSATVGSTVTWGQRNFKINLSSARQTMLSRGNTMNGYSWKPTSNVRGWKNRITYYANTTYYGLPYSQTAYQCSISPVSWSYGYYFDQKLTDSSSGFYDNYTSGGIIMPKYGNDCSGYVSVSWNTSRKTTTTIASLPAVGKSTDTKLQKYARMSPGDAFVISGSHTFMVKEITPINDSNGNLVKFKFTCNEQTPYNCKTSIWYSDALSTAGYKGVVKSSTYAQDYSWSWQ